MQEADSACPQCRAERSTVGWPVDHVIGDVISSKYRILKRLGTGGFGVVYLAEHVEFQAKRAIKVLHERFTYDDRVVQRFQREARAVYRLNGPHIVRLEEYGATKTGAPFMALEFAEGVPLVDILKESAGGLPVRRAIRIARQVAIALVDAARVGVLHRDLKPDNIVVKTHPQRGDEIKVLDFGIAKIIDEDALTLTGTTIIGTPEYMAPEQWQSAHTVDARADLFSLGVVLFEMLTATVPWRQEGDPFTVFALMTDNPLEPIETTLQQKPLPEDVKDLVKQLLAINPDDRIQTARETIGRIDQLKMLTTSALHLDTPLSQLRLSRDVAAPQPAPAQPTVPPVQPAPANASLSGAVETESTGFAPTLADDSNPTYQPQYAEAPTGKVPTQSGAGSNAGAVVLAMIVVAAIATIGILLVALPGDSTDDEADAGQPQHSDAVDNGHSQPTADGSTTEPTNHVSDVANRFPQMVLIDGGQVPIGQSEENLASQVADFPVSGNYIFMAPQTVTLDPFLIDRFEVTSQQYIEYLQVTGPNSQFHERFAAVCPSAVATVVETENPLEPVSDISYLEAALFCEYMGKRLPTFEEWEVAARGSDGRRFPWGEEIGVPGAFNAGMHGQSIHDLNECVLDGFAGPAPVTAFANGSSPFNAQAMAGNVSEWVTGPDHRGDQAPYFHRGGGYLSHPIFIQTYAYQFLASPCLGHANIGFRCARDFPEAE